MITFCTIKFNFINDEYHSTIIYDGMKTISFDCGIVEVDYAYALYVAKHTYHTIDIHQNVIEFVEDSDSYYWQPTKYGEYIIRLPCEYEKESV